MNVLNKLYDAKNEWTKFFVQTEMAYPSEYVIRLFKGEYPRLHLKKDSFRDKKICDIGCGDGRNLVLLKQVGFDVYGVEITQQIVDKIVANLKMGGIEGVKALVGVNDHLPFETGFFDYLLSWNACYYMGRKKDFTAYVKEFSRVLKPGGRLILSIPKKTCFIYHNSMILTPGYQIIKNDPFGVRMGKC